ncbi:MAG: hypothetical protein ACYTF7_00960 [Planctomycetota bacterium]|jgi:hypothetical protein
MTIATAGGGAFGGESHTGTLNLSADGNTFLAGVLIDGVPVAFSNTTIALAGTIDLNNGDVTGGSFSVTIDGTEIYSASISGSVGSVNTQAGQGFTIDGLTFNGLFNTSSWANVDVSTWDDAEPLTGSFLNFAFNPDGNGIDADSDMEVYIYARAIPLPATAGLATVGLMGLSTRRRRSI